MQLFSRLSSCTETVRACQPNLAEATDVEYGAPPLYDCARPLSACRGVEAGGELGAETPKNCWGLKTVVDSRFFRDPVDMSKKNTGDRFSSRKSTRKSAANNNRVADFMFDPPLPNITDNYTMMKDVSMGILRLAIHRGSRQRRAVLTLSKRYVPAGATDDPAQEIKRHLETLLKIDHVNILALHEACEDARYIYLVYDWPEGGMLLDHFTLYHEDVTEAHLSSLARETLGAIAAASRFNVHHLDWSLLCLFLGYKNCFSPLKLFGVGLAGILVPLVSSRKFSRSNKHFYVSPELLQENYRNMPHAKLHSCDIWSVGTVLYMLISGRPPFCGSYDEVLERIKKAQWTFGYEFDSVSREAKDGIEGMMRKKWDARPTAPELLKHPFLHQQIGATKNKGVICQDALSKLAHFARETKCKQTLARLLADLGLQESLYSELEAMFRQLDLDGNGVVEVGELSQVAASLPHLDSDKVTAIIAACDRNGNATVDISEFVAALVLELENKDESLLVKAFDKMDMNGDARITKGEIFRVLRQYSGSLEPSDISGFVQDMDKDKDQKVDYNEFKLLFPHLKDKDTEIKERITGLSSDVAHKKKTFGHLQTEIDKFFKLIRTTVGMLAQEHAKLMKAQLVEQAVQERVQELFDCIREFAGHADASVASAGTAEDVKEVGKKLTGFTVMKSFSTKDTGREKGQQSGELRHTVSSSSIGSSPRKSGSEAELTVLSARPPAQNTALLQREPGETLTLADLYTMRGLTGAGKSLADFRQEGNRRRAYLWLGMGDGVKNLSNTIRPSKGKVLESPSRRRKQEAEAAEKAKDLASSAGTDAAGKRREPSAPDTTENGSAEQRRDSSSDEENGDFVHWGPARRIKNAKEAMFLAAGEPIKEIGTFTRPELQKEELQQLSRKFLSECQLHSGVSSQLCDLHKLIRYKCCRSWMPPLALWKAELKSTMDEQKTPIPERRKVHSNCIRYCCQLVERILFSLTDYLAWQELAFQAMFKMEESVEMPPASRRFLPYRAGEFDEDARTPRDEEDAVMLAPAEHEMALQDEPEESGAASGSPDRFVSFTEDATKSIDPVAQSARDLAKSGMSQTGLGTRATGLSMSGKLDRNSVRLSKIKSEGKVDEKVRQMAKDAHAEAMLQR